MSDKRRSYRPVQIQSKVSNSSIGANMYHAPKLTPQVATLANSLAHTAFTLRLHRPTPIPGDHSLEWLDLAYPDNARSQRT
jgi:hypothetical protein